MEELAIFGGKPVRETPIFYGRQCIEQDDIDAVVETLRSDLITCGPKAAELEKKLCEITGAKYAVIVANGTAALHLAALAAGFQEGDEVIVSSITFAASANCVRYCGAMPVFADIRPDTYNIDPEAVKKLITPKTKGIVAVDFTGQAVELDRLLKICHDRGILLIEDGAHSIGTIYDGRPVGSVADMTTFSFHPVKTVTGGEGGAVLTNDEKLYTKLKLYQTHGITREAELLEKEPDGGWYYEQVALGMNYRMTDMQAALISSQLDKLQLFSDRRKEIVAKYNEAFSEVPQIRVQQEIPESDTTRHLYILRIVPEKLSIDRKKFFDAMAAENICCNVHYIPVYFHPYYEKLGYEKGLCPQAEKLYSEMMSLPLYYAMTDEDVKDVIAAVKKLCAYYAK